MRAAQGLFFPAAAIHAAAILPLSVVAYVSGRPLLPGVSTPAGHAHEMLFGFALAVVAGFLINRISPRRLWILFGLWCAARVSFLLVPGAYVAHLLNIAFAVYLAVMAAPQFLSAAKKWRNRIFAPTIVALCAAVALFHIGGIMQWQLPTRVALREGVLLLALLMAFMGGRVIAPALAGYLQSRGGTLDARVQPRLEALLLVCLIVALVFATVPGADKVTGILLVAAAAVALVRLLRWRPWRYGRRVDLLSLLIGYLWLILGLGLLGSSYVAAHPGLGNPTTALHALTVGALGTLTLTVMARTRVIKLRQHPASIKGLAPAVALVSLAAIWRLAGAQSPVALLCAAGFWSAAFLLLLRMFYHAGSAAEPSRAGSR